MRNCTRDEAGSFEAAVGQRGLMVGGEGANRIPAVIVVLIDWAIHVEAGIVQRVADVIDYVGEVEAEAVSLPDTRRSRDAIHHKVGPASRIVVDDATDPPLGFVGNAEYV
jgi:hypothetical protein